MRALVEAFVDTINRRDADRLAELMTEDHVFIDSLGRAVHGREQMRQAWHSYFHLFPDYTIVCDEVFEHAPVYALFGTASGTYSLNGQLLPENRWEIPAAWRAVVRDQRIAEWRVYADNYQTVKLLREQ